MAQIGTFTRNEDGSFAGVIKTLNLSVKARLVVAEKDSEKSPDLRALVGNIEIGAAWKKVAKETGREYHSSSSTIRAFPLRSTRASWRTKTATLSSGRAEAANQRRGAPIGAPRSR
jgi:uncharacterized protein (DUF736 family)